MSANSVDSRVGVEFYLTKVRHEIVWLQASMETASLRALPRLPKVDLGRGGSWYVNYVERRFINNIDRLHTLTLDSVSSESGFTCTRKASRRVTTVGIGVTVVLFKSAFIHITAPA